MPANPGDLLFQNLSSIQSDKQPLPPTIASAATIVPTHQFTLVTGTVVVTTITPPVSGYHQLTLMYTNAAPGLGTTAGNIGIAYQPIQNRPITYHYDPGTGKYWPNSVV